MLRMAWKYSKGEKLRFAWVYFRFMMSNVVQALYPVIYGVFVNDVQKNGTDVMRHVWIYAAGFLGIRLGDWIFHGPARLTERELAFTMSRNFLQEMYHKTLKLPVKWHQDNHSGATINRVRKAYEALRDFFQQGFEYLHTIFKFVFSFGAMVYFSPLFGGISIIFGAIIVFIILKFDKPYMQTLDEVNEGEHVVSSTLFDSLSNVVTVITLRLESRMENGLLEKVKMILKPFKRNVAINEWKWFVTDLLVGFIYVFVMLGYVWQNWEIGKPFMLGGLVMLMGYVERFTSVFHGVAYLYTDVVKHATNVRTAQSILDAYEENHIAELEKTLPENWEKIEIKNLNYTHQGRETNVENSNYFAGIKNLNFEIKKGQKIALIGESGSGKSTLLAILRGLYGPETSEIIIDGEVKKEGIALISNYVTFFPQEPEIFENTIAYNITLGLPCNEELMQEICENVHFLEVIGQLPNGFESNIVEKGVNLSGGQKQRLALARGVFAAQDSEIILLDEPTSSVDPMTESKIYKNLFERFNKQVIISSLHRLHLLPLFDYIYVMEGGQVKAEGNLEFLLKSSETFQKLWKHQEDLIVTS
ncbi:ABC transporter ATP-binding protein [Lacihabitans sp. CS3-21]|nr:ABC transporter ATP-binding protein [Lacihabitans sp. CS3-21]